LAAPGNHASSPSFLSFTTKQADLRERGRAEYDKEGMKINEVARGQTGCDFFLNFMTMTEQSFEILFIF
jgi:hypothetical protein